MYISFFLTVFFYLFIKKNTPISGLIIITFSYFLVITILGFVSVMFLLFKVDLNYIDYFFYLLIVLVFISLIALKKLGNFIYEIKTLLKKIILKIKSLPISIIILLLLVIFSSFGPVNHPDATIYHVGFPYHALVNSKITDIKDLHLGLTGLGDWSHLIFIKENQDWFIRLIGTILLIPAIIFLNDLKISKWLIYFLLTMPVMIQWTTIGKPFLIFEIPLALLTINYIKSKNMHSLFFLLATMIFALSFKISNLMNVFVILLFILYLNKSNLRNLFLSRRYLILLFICVLISSSIFVLRYQIFGNPFFPFLNEYFSLNKKEVLEFKTFLINYNKDNYLWPIKLFIPFRIGEVGYVLGPVSIIILLISIFNQRKLFNQINISFLGIISMFSLIFFGQARADYFFLPMFFLIYGFTLDVGNFLKKSGKFLIVGQITFTSIFYIIAISQNILVLYNYNYMKKFAYGFDVSEIAKKQKSVVLINGFEDTKYYFDFEYIHDKKFSSCREENQLSYCINKYQINSVVFKVDNDNSTLNEFQQIGFFCADKKSIFQGARNAFNIKRVELTVCNLSDNKINN